MKEQKNKEQKNKEQKSNYNHEEHTVMVNTRRIFCSNNTWVDHYIQIHEYLYLEAGLWYMYTKPVSKEEYKFCTVWEILGGAYGVPGSPCNSHAIGNEYSEIYIYMYIITSQRTRWFCNLLNILPIFLSTVIKTLNVIDLQVTDW